MCKSKKTEKPAFPEKVKRLVRDMNPRDRDQETGHVVVKGGVWVPPYEIINLSMFVGRFFYFQILLVSNT